MCLHLPVNEADVISSDGVLQGVSVQNGLSLSVEEIADEITSLMALVNHEAKAKVTGGGKGLLTIPLYHSKHVHGENFPG